MRYLLSPLAALGGALALACSPVLAGGFVASNLVTDDPLANPGQITDAGLVNGWGISYSATGPFWVSSNGASTSTLYRVDPATDLTTKLGLTVSIPGTGSVTGQVFNGNAAAFNGDNFLFVSEDGTVSGWRGALGTQAQTLTVGSASNVYKGAALGSVGGNSYLYSANFATGNVDVLKGSAAAPDLAGHFTDPNLPAGYAPFNVQNLGGSLYVAYAVPDAAHHDEVAGAGLGMVDRFDLNGNLVARIATGGPLNAPWGLAIAPSSFGAMAGDLLVGNFGDGRISVYGASGLVGQVLGPNGQPLVIEGLWGLSPGNGVGAGAIGKLYFSAGPNGEAHGVFGVLNVSAVPEPGTAWMWLGGMALLAGAMKRRR